MQLRPRRIGDPDVEFEASVCRGGVLLMTGRVEGASSSTRHWQPPAPASWPRSPPWTLGAAQGNQDAMDGFARVNAGVMSPAEYFSDGNVSRILATRERELRADGGSRLVT